MNVPALEASIGSPYCVVQSKNGDVYLSSHVHHVILKVEFDKTEGTWSTVTIIAGTGSAGKGNDGDLGTESALSFPTGISLVESGKSGELTAILITDYNNHRIRKLDMKTQLITTIAGNGFGVSQVMVTRPQVHNSSSLTMRTTTSQVAIFSSWTLVTIA